MADKEQGHEIKHGVQAIGVEIEEAMTGMDTKVMSSWFVQSKFHQQNKNGYKTANLSQTDRTRVSGNAHNRN